MMKHLDETMEIESLRFLSSMVSGSGRDVSHSLVGVLLTGFVCKLIW